MQPLADPIDLASRLGVTLATSAQTEMATTAIADASAKIRNYTRQSFTLVTDDVVHLEPTVEQWLFLPQRPVVSVSAVRIGGAVLTPVYYYAEGDALYRRDGWSGRFYGITEAWNQPDTIQVTYTHGFTVVPADIVSIACKLARSSFVNPQGMRSFIQGDMQGAWDSQTVSVGDLDADDKKVLDYYRRPRRSVKLSGRLL